MSSQNANIKNKDTDDKISLKDLILKITGWWHYLLSKWLIIVVIGLLGGGLGFVYAIMKKPVYTAKLTFVLEEGDTKNIGNLGGLAAMAGINFGSSGGGIFRGDNIIELYKSRSMISKTLLSSSPTNDSLLIERYITFNEIREDWKENPGLKNIRFNIPKEQFTLQHDSIMGKVVKIIKDDNLNISKPNKQLSLISVQTKFENETFSKDFTEALVKNVNDFYIETKIGKSAENLAILQSQTDSVRQELNSAIGGVAMALDANPNANTARQVLRVPSSKRQVDVQANQAILLELVKNLETSKISLRRETPLIQVIDEPVLPLEMERFGKTTGIALGGFLAGLLICFILILIKEITDILEGE